MTPDFYARVGRLQFMSLLIGVVALAASAVGAFINGQQFFHSYLFGCLFWLGLSLGCLLVTMIHIVTGGRWGYPTRRFLEAGFGALPLMLVLFIPIFFGLHDLYPWARPEIVAGDQVLRERHAWQNPPAFIVRAILFFFLWILMSSQLRKWSLMQDQTTDAAPTRKMRALSGPGLVIYPLSATFAYVDWIMSLEPHWYSTLFAVIVIVGQILVAYAFSIIMLALFRREDSLKAVVNKTHYHHLGNLLLTFVIFWTYVSFGQLLIIYSGDLPREIQWYLHRIAGNWKWVVGMLALFHFFLPFFLLLFRAVKRHVVPLTLLASVLFAVHIVDMYWLVMPSFHVQGVSLSWQDFVAPAGVGGIWLAFVLSRLKVAPLLPRNDPGLQFAFDYEQFQNTSARHAAGQP